jgi:hypothetical protein
MHKTACHGNTAQAAGDHKSTIYMEAASTGDPYKLCFIAPRQPT